MLYQSVYLGECAPLALRGRVCIAHLVGESMNNRIVRIQEQAFVYGKSWALAYSCDNSI
jgi:hypothetical protein